MDLTYSIILSSKKYITIDFEFASRNNFFDR